MSFPTWPLKLWQAVMIVCGILLLAVTLIFLMGTVWLIHDLLLLLSAVLVLFGIFGGPQ